MEQLLELIREEPPMRELAGPVTSSPGPRPAARQRSSRVLELSVLITLLFVALFCASGTYYWKARAYPSASLWKAVFAGQRNPATFQSNARFQEYQRWVPIRKGDHVIPVGETAADVREVHGVPREAVVVSEGRAIKRFVVLGPNSYLVSTTTGRNQILRRDEIGLVISAQTASR
jgi:hypothetical protein